MFLKNHRLKKIRYFALVIAGGSCAVINLAGPAPSEDFIFKYAVLALMLSLTVAAALVWE